MTITEFLTANGCPCFTKAAEDGSHQITMPDGRRVRLHAGIDCHTKTQLVRGAGRRPKKARRRRPWLRARRVAMRRTGKPPANESITYVGCMGCGTTAETTEHLDGAW